jgi:hypothetical protein
LRADAFRHGVRADIAGQSLNARDARLATLGYDVGRAVFEREILPVLVAAHDDNSGRAHLLGREHAHQADRAYGAANRMRIRLATLGATALSYRIPQAR